MALSGARLSGSLKTDILAQLQSLFPINANLLTAEKAALVTAQTNFANAIGSPVGSDTVTEIASNAIVNPVTLSITPNNIVAPSGGGACSGNGLVTTGNGSVS